MGTTAEDLSTEQLRADLARQRGEITGTLEAIGDRVSPGRAVERKRAAVRNRLTSVKESVMGTPDFDPRAKAIDLRDSAGAAAGAVGDTASAVAGKVAEAPELASRQVQGNPLAAGLIAFGAGLLVATVLPESDPERRVARKVQPQLEDAARQAREIGQEVAADLKDQAGQAAEEVRATATDATQAVKDEAQQAGQQVRDEASGSTGNGRPPA